MKSLKKQLALLSQDFANKPEVKKRIMEEVILFTAGEIGHIRLKFADETFLRRSLVLTEIVMMQDYIHKVRMQK